MSELLGDPTNRGAGESLGSLREHAKKHSNWYDQYNAMFGKGVDDINYNEREFDDDGRVKVTKYDILLGRSQPELQAAYESQRQARLRNSEANSGHKRLFDGKGAVPEKGEKLYAPNRTNEGDITSKNQTEITRKKDVSPLLQELGRMEDGASAVASLGRKPTVEQVAGKIGELKPKQKSYVDAGRQIESSLETESTNRDVATAGVAIQRGQLAVQRDQLGLNTTIADNNQTLALAKLDHAGDVAQQQVDIANIKLRNQSAQANADRDLRRDLAMLTRDDNKDERVYRRERDERKDRQMMIMQLLGGLKNIGGAFAP